MTAASELRTTAPLGLPDMCAIVQDEYPLTDLQQGILLASLTSRGRDPYVHVICGYANEFRDADAFERAWQFVIDRTDVLRTSFHWEDTGQPLQRVHQAVTARVRHFDWRDRKRAQQRVDLQSFVDQQAYTRFQLDEPLLFHCDVIRLSDDACALVLTLHHIILDGRSIASLMTSTVSAYRSLRDGEAPSMQESRPFRNYVDWITTQDFSESESFWRSELNGYQPARLTLPRASSLSTGESWDGEQPDRFHTERATLSREESRAVNQLADSLYTTANTIVQAAWALVLGQLSGRDDVVFGATRAGRRLPVSGIRKMIGLLVTVVPLRIRWQESATVYDFLGSIREQWLNLRDHEYVPNSVHREHLRFSDTDSLIDTSITFEGMGLNQTMKEPDGSPMPSSAELATERAVAIHVYGGSQIEVHVVVHPDHGDASTARILIERLKTAMLALVEHQQGTMAETLRALVPVQECEVIREANATFRGFDNDLLVHELIEQAAARHPDRTAVESREMSLTYETLNRRANALARTLAELGLNACDSVAVMWSRDADLAVVLLAVLKSNATLVPLDARQPKRRLASIFESVQPEFVVVQKPLAQHLPATDATMVVLESCDDSLAVQPADNVEAHVAPDSLAYTIYTSGSTGYPKGVDVSHRSLANLIKTKQAEPGLSAEDCVVAATTISFDPAMLQLTLPLAVGARLVIADERATFGGEPLAQFLADFDATFLMTSPVMIDTLRQCGWTGKSNLRVSYGGEPLAEGLAEWILPRVESLWNCYGPTEATIHCVQTKIEQPADTRYIGRPLANTNALVLDSGREQVAVGRVGELYVGGTCLAKGYRNADHLTSERFIAHPLALEPDARLYRTGDLARWTTDGQLEYLGREDEQVKLQGVRVELSEVEHALEEHHAVSRAVVVSTGENGQAELTGFVVPQETRTPAKAHSLRGALRQHLFETLPAAMHPRHLEVVDTIPSTLQGKVDRSALLRDFHTRSREDADDRQHVSDQDALQSDLEKKLVRIWQLVLDRQDVSVDDDFFELGGNSLLALRMFNMLEDEMSVRVPVANLVHYRTIRSIASLVESDDGVEHRSLVVELQPQGNRPPVFCAHGIGGEVVQLTELAKHLPREQPLFGIQAVGRDTEEKPFSSIEKMAARYIQEMKRYQAQGPYYLAGYSFGGGVAFEMAQQLSAAGDEVGALIVIDTASQTYVRENPKWIYIPRFLIHLPVWFFGDYIKSGWRSIWGRPARLIRLAARGVWNRIKLPRRTQDQVDVEAVFYAPQVPERYRRVYEAHYRALRAYQAKPYPGKVTLLRSRITGLFGSLEKDLGWSDVAKGGVEVNYVAGSHATMLLDPHVETLAHTLTRVALEAQVIQQEKAAAAKNS